MIVSHWSRSFCALAVVVIVHVAPATARAEAVLATSIVIAEPGEAICCNMVNVGTKTIEVRVGLSDDAGVDLGIAPDPAGLGPGAGATYCLGDLFQTQSLWCRFTMTKGSKAALRASACRKGVGGCEAIEPAR